MGNNKSENINENGYNDIAAGTFPYEIYILNLDRKPERYEYVTQQLNSMGLKNYLRWSAVDGFKTSPEILMTNGLTKQFSQKKGLAGCASSHINLWRHIYTNKMDWTLILEDDAHFHPDFLKLFYVYWNKTPKKAVIVFPGFCCGPEYLKNEDKLVIEHSVMCLHGYMISWKGAEYLLNKLLPINNPIDIEITHHFKNNHGSYIFNDQLCVNNIVPDNYKKANGKKCIFNGIIYQNHQDAGSTIHTEQTIYN